MTSSTGADAIITGSLRVVDGRGAVRMDAHFEAGTDDVWSALTDPERLSRWYGEVQGDFREGGEYHASLFASGWEGRGRIVTCEASRPATGGNRGGPR